MTYEEAEKRRQYVIAREAGKAGLRGKIDAKCVECIYDPIAGKGTWRQQVLACTAVSCPLHDVRTKPENC
jgi:hypothetical protein